MKLKLEEVDTKIFEEYRRVIVFSDNDIEFQTGNENLRYFTLFDMASILEDYIKLFSIFGNQKLPYLFIFNFPYDDRNFLEKANYIQIV